MSEIMTLREARAKGIAVDYPQNPRGEGAPYYGGTDGKTLLGHRKFSGIIPHPNGGMLVREDGRGFVPAPFMVKALVELEEGTFRGTVIAIGDAVAGTKARINSGKLGTTPDLRVWMVSPATTVGQIVCLP